MNEVLAKFIEEYADEYGWRHNPNPKHFYVWISFSEINDFCKLIPWEMTEYNIMQNCVLLKDCICVDLCEIFWREDIEKFFPINKEKE